MNPSPSVSYFYEGRYEQREWESHCTRGKSPDENYWGNFIPHKYGITVNKLSAVQEEGGGEGQEEEKIEIEIAFPLSTLWWMCEEAGTEGEKQGQCFVLSTGTGTGTETEGK